jgi:hypothetical protein
VATTLRSRKVQIDTTYPSAGQRFESWKGRGELWQRVETEGIVAQDTRFAHRRKQQDLLYASFTGLFDWWLLSGSANILGRSIVGLAWYSDMMEDLAGGGSNVEIVTYPIVSQLVLACQSPRHTPSFYACNCDILIVSVGAQSYIVN